MSIYPFLARARLLLELHMPKLVLLEDQYSPYFLTVGRG